MKLIAKLLLHFILLLILVLLLNVLLHRQSNRIIAQWKQPETIAYKSFDPYFFTVVEGEINWKQFPLNWERRYFIYVGRDSGEPGYGHFLDYSFHPGFDGLETHLKKSTVLWSNDGLTFKEASGHILFIPKEMFIGGR